MLKIILILYDDIKLVNLVYLSVIVDSVETAVPVELTYTWRSLLKAYQVY